LLCIIAFNLEAQISIYPPSLFIDNRTRSAELTIKNTSIEMREIVMESIFGYIGYDSLGNRIDIYGDTINLIKYSLSKYLKIFPPKLIVPPNELQTVRVFLLNLPDLPDGTYFTRFSAISNPIAKQIDTTNQGKLQATVSLRTKMISAIFYQKGNLKTNINFSMDELKIDSIYINLFFNVEVSGNSPFWGKMKYKIYDDKGKELLESEEFISFYVQSRKRISIDRNLLPKGKYKIEMVYSTDRIDIPEERRIPFKEKKQEFDFIID
jgi:hypothetical protein